MLAPGFVDLQVNGGGGVMLNDHPDVEGIETICRAHAPFGTTALLPTLITDTPEVTAAVVAAGIEAARRKVPGFAGLHLEGPHLSIARKGAHDAKLIRPMTDADQAALIAARKELPALLTTVAPESVTPAQVTALTQAGIVVSLGHTDASYATATRIRQGGRDDGHASVQRDEPDRQPRAWPGRRCHRQRLAVRRPHRGWHSCSTCRPSKSRCAQSRGPGNIFLVTDAMATIGTDLTNFTLNGRTIYRKDGRLTLADGTLAGADLDMISAVRFMCGLRGIDLRQALRMASLYPAQSYRPAGQARAADEGERRQHRGAVRQARHARSVDRRRAGLRGSKPALKEKPRRRTGGVLLMQPVTGSAASVWDRPTAEAPG